MATSLWSTGPAHIFAAGHDTKTSPPSLGNFWYFGTAERCPLITIEAAYREIYADGQNQPIPADKILIGEKATITALMTRWDEDVYARMARRANPTKFLTDIGTHVRGSMLAADPGTMIIAESQWLQLYIQFPFFQMAPYQQYRLPTGYLFFGVTLQGPDEFTTIGTEGRKLLCQWTATGVVDGDQTLVDGGTTGSYALYKTDASPNLPQLS